MTDAQTEARAIAARIEKRIFQAEQARQEMIYADLYGWPNAILGLIEAAQEAATALAAKDAELAEAWEARAEQWRLRREAESARDMMSALATTFRAERDEARAQLAEANKALERHRSERSYVVGWNDGFAHAASEDLKFPTMLRKMWSGGEVQAWLDEQFAARRAREAQGGENG